MNKLKLLHVTTFDSSSQRAPKNVVKYSPEYEIALSNLIIMLAPIAPHFASELWAKFLAVPNRVVSKPTDDQTGIDWTKDVLEQSWPVISKDFHYWLDVRVKNLNEILFITSIVVQSDFVSISRLIKRQKLCEYHEPKRNR